MSLIIRDIDLTTTEQMIERCSSINRQIDKLGAIRQPKDYTKHHNKYVKLVDRLQKLKYRIATEC